MHFSAARARFFSARVVVIMSSVSSFRRTAGGGMLRLEARSDVMGGRLGLERGDGQGVCSRRYLARSSAEVLRQLEGLQPISRHGRRHAPLACVFAFEPGSRLLECMPGALFLTGSVYLDRLWVLSCVLGVIFCKEGGVLSLVINLSLRIV